VDRKAHPFGPIFGPHLQTAYVTTDLTEAMQQFASLYGIASFVGPNLIRMQTGSGAAMAVKTALAFSGPSMIELIEPDGGADDLYRNFLPSTGFAIRHHHYAAEVENDAQWQDLLEQVEKNRHPVALRGDQQGVKFLYIDTHKQLGHYIEYLYFYDQSQFSLAAIPRN
jgi:hypothetical protein